MGHGDPLGIGEGSDSYIEERKPEELIRSLRESLNWQKIVDILGLTGKDRRG